MLIRAVTITIEEREEFTVSVEAFQSRFPDAVIQRIDGKSQMKAPTRPGWYWRAHYLTGRWEPVEIYIARPAPMTPAFMVGKLCCQDDTDNGECGLVQEHGRWGGECLGMPF